MRVRQTPISNEEFIARYREWRSLWKPTSEQVAYEVSYFQTGGTYGSDPAFERDEGRLSGFLSGRRISPAAARVSSEDPVGSDRDRCVSRRDTKEREKAVTIEPTHSSSFNSV